MTQRRDLSHVDEQGRSRMVDVGEKRPTVRRAIAAGRVRVSEELARRIAERSVEKGDPLETARIAGIQAAKRTEELIPLCHSLPLDHADVHAWVEADAVEIRAEVKTTARTGVEMEALTAVSVAALTVVDMGKAVDRAMVVEQVRLEEKSGGRSGPWRREPGP